MDMLIQAAADYYVITVLGLCFVFGSVMKTVASIAGNATREKSRREIAAYIAEGSMSADQGERLIRADVNRGHQHAA